MGRSTNEETLALRPSQEQCATFATKVQNFTANLSELATVPCPAVPFALCYFAPCRPIPGTDKALCGCYEGNETNFVNIKAIYANECIRNQTWAACPGGIGSCSGVGQPIAPICDFVRHPKALYPDADLISDWAPHVPGSPRYQGDVPCPRGDSANCMTAPCKKTPITLNGQTYKVTCECPIAKSMNYTIAATTPQTPCYPGKEDGLVWSGIPDPTVR